MKLAALQSVALLLLAATLCHGAPLEAIPEVLPDANGITSVTLVVNAARLTIPNVVTFTTRAYYVNGTARIHGPTLVLQPGGRLNITLINNLADDSANDAIRPMNVFRHCNTTNVHTHGLHVDPAIDSIFRLAGPGGVLNYDIPLPYEHAPGMHWYHSHAHGGSTLHVMGGLLGAMYMRPLARDNIPAALSAMTSHRLVIQMFNFAPETVNGVVSQACTPAWAAPYNPFKTFAFSELESNMSSLMPSNPTYLGTDRFFLTVNGQFQPTVSMAPGESRLFQVVYGASSKMPCLIFPTGCTVQHLAFDGVYFTSPRTATYIQFVTGTRAEFVMTCAAAGTYAVTYVINGNVDNVRTTGGTTLFSAVVSGTTVTTPTIPSPLNITRPTYLTDLRSLTTTDTSYHISMAQGGAGDCLFWLGSGTNCTPSSTAAGPGGGNGPMSTTCSSSHFMGQKYTNDTSKYKFSMRVGQTAEWSIWAGGNNAHPLHIHVNHFQIAGWTGEDAVVGHWVTQGDWRDTIAIATVGVRIRWAAHYYAGETVVHCHELHHEDHGLMDTFLILPSLTDTTTASSSGTSGGTTSAATPVPLGGGIGNTAAPSSHAGDHLLTKAIAATLVLLATVLLTVI